jgi:predicted porin
MRARFLASAATAALSIALFSQDGGAATLDDVMQRLEALERSNAKLAGANAELRRRVNQVERKPMTTAPAAAAPEPAASPKGNPVLHGAVATTPGQPAPGGSVNIGGMVVKAGPMGPAIDNTTVTIYGHVDVSGDLFNPSVWDQGNKFGIASNSSYFGIRARHNLTPYGYPGWAIVAQFESQVDVAATPNERAAFGTRDSFVGLETQWGAIKAGKADSPYKRSTAVMDPFASTLGDYNSIMGNTGGDNRAEFDWRMSRAVWYESPIWNGFQFSAMFSAGQNYAPDNSDYSYGDTFTCNGASIRGSGSNFPNTGGAVPGNIGGNGCTDGSYGNAYSAAVIYKNGPFTAIGAYELHEGVNRQGDDGLQPGLLAPVFLPDGSQVITGVHNEWAAKAGAGYRIDAPWGPLQFYAFYEKIKREGAPAAFDERSRDGWFVSATQYLGDHWSLSASWAHAGNTPGNPATLSNNNANAQTDMYQANLFGDAANQYAVGTRYRFNPFASWYLVGAMIQQQPGAHYCLGASGHGYQICSRDQFNDTIGGATIKAVTTGLTFDF